MTVDKLVFLQKAEDSRHEKSEGGFKPLALDDVTTMHSNFDEFRQRSQSIFSKVDRDGDGYVSNNEIETRLNSKKIDKLEANALERMRTTYAELMNQSNDEWGSENNGISRADINTLVTSRQQTAHEIDAAKHALNVMHRVHKQQHPYENTAG